MRRFARFGAPLLVGVFVTAACSRATPESLEVIAAIDRYRAADNQHKPELADALAKVACSEKDVCAARDACVKVAAPTAKGLRLQREVSDALADLAAGRIDKESPAARVLPSRLDESTRLLDEGERGLAECARATSTLRVARGL